MGNVFKGIPARQSVTNYGCISSTRECPTCRGSGVIEDGISACSVMWKDEFRSENSNDFILFFSFVPDAGASNGSEYIALIPLTDQRLRPQRITIKILLTVMLCLVISGLLLFFLMLRSVELSSADHLLLPDNVNITESTVSLNLSYPINVTNWNFVPLHVESVDLMAFYHAYVLKQTEANLDEWVPARSTKELHVNQTLVFDDPIFSVYYFESVIYFRSNVKMNTLGQHFESVLDTFQLVSCYPPNLQL
ncbi:unnamed protein product [Hymenolepis diminuta]|uniref:SEA domain-containing protein n=1 Tax=Hymenolepis diminuta TaxID=6216 RepID=A0A0R3SAB8_HYMDI|nr:unnamed protein product [Hymenolepis diminuta]